MQIYAITKILDMEPLILSRVVLSWDVLWSCLSHSLTTEHQEIMGLLLGSLQGETTVEAFIRRSIVLTRKDKKRDRVEVGYENLAAASIVAEKLSDSDGEECRVLGWYHSHPHITVLPSHVDVRTQGYYQQMERGFLGIIFSVFDKGKFEICAFQSRGTGTGIDNCTWDRLEIPIEISMSVPRGDIQCLNPFEESGQRAIESLIALQLILLNEDRQAFAREIASSSCLTIARAAMVFQGATAMLLDLQLLPLKYSLKSRIESLKKQKEILLHRNGTDHRDESLPQHLPSPSATKIKFNNALDAMEAAVPEWSLANRALILARDGVHGLLSSCHHPTLSSPPSALPLGSTVLVRIIPTPKTTIWNPTHSTCSPSPWTLLLGDFRAPLIHIIPSALNPTAVEFHLYYKDEGYTSSDATDLTVTVSFESNGHDHISAHSPLEVAKLFREELHRALYLPAVALLS